jgi:hypothetical protein
MRFCNAMRGITSASGCDILRLEANGMPAGPDGITLNFDRISSRGFPDLGIQRWQVDSESPPPRKTRA